jgi:O-acetyl-ADP-ribose deacetylase (regulator of RNase III)
LYKQVDVIVNSTNSELNLRIGRLSKAIVKDGGDEIESKLEELYPNGILRGEIAESKAGNLKCKAIYHGVLVDWDNGQGHAEMVTIIFIVKEM